MPKGVPKNGINKGWFKEGQGFWAGKKRPNMEGNSWNLGKPSWNKGITGYSLPKRNNPIEDKAYNWRGDSVGYGGIHAWVRRHKGKAAKCTVCGDSRPRYIQWANIDHKYNRNLEDFIELCAKCHRSYDRGTLII